LKTEEFCTKKDQYPDAVIFSVFDNTTAWIFSGQYFWDYDLKKQSLLKVTKISNTFENLTGDVDAAFVIVNRDMFPSCLAFFKV